jgi:hypothetical protein
MCYQLHHPGLLAAVKRGERLSLHERRRTGKHQLKSVHLRLADSLCNLGEPRVADLRWSLPSQAEFSRMIGTQVDARNESPHLEHLRPTRQGSVANPKVIDGQQFAAFGAAPKGHIGKMHILLAHTSHLV